MKANELMIGDWVVYNGDVDYINPIKIEGMDIATGMCVTTDRDDVGFDGVWPIPLTAEILEKNGFEFNNLPMEQCWQQYGLRLYFSGRGYGINCGENVSLCIDYVHQLQHALRLCGINKEIII